MFYHTNNDLKMVPYIHNVVFSGSGFTSVSFFPSIWSVSLHLKILPSVAQASASVLVACSPHSIQGWLVLPMCLCHPTLHMRTWTLRKAKQPSQADAELWALADNSGAFQQEPGSLYVLKSTKYASCQFLLFQGQYSGHQKHGPGTLRARVKTLLTSRNMGLPRLPRGFHARM